MYILVIIVIIMKRDLQFKAGRGRFAHCQSEDLSPTERKERKEKNLYSYEVHLLLQCAYTYSKIIYTY